MHAFFTIHDPRQRWVVSRHPPINPAFAIAEIIWILNGRRDAAFVNFWNPQLPRYSGTAKEYHGAYGYRLRRHFGLDQLERAYFALRRNPIGRQVVLQIWDAFSDLPSVNGEPVNADIPCNIVSILKIRDNKLEWMQVLRSNDLFLGIPYNFVQFTTLQEVMAGWLDVDLGAYNHLSDSLHVYESDLSDITLDLSIKAENNSDSLCLPKDQADKAFMEMSYCMDQMASSSISDKELARLVGEQNFAKPYKNLLLVVAAELARKNKWQNVELDMMGHCTNPILSQLWNRWSGKFQS
jgi:thymidylate synthase